LVNRKKVAFVILLLIIAGTFYVTSAPLSVSPDEPMNLFNIFSSLCGTSLALCDPVPGSGGSGGDN
jgi:hypothetical protein